MQPSRLEHILLSCRRSIEGVYVASFTLYFDDSGTHLESPVAIAAAWVSPVLQWKRFEREWDTVKAKEGFSCFHTSECVAGNNGFASWDDEKKHRVMRRLAQVAMKRGTQGFAVAVHKKDYDDLFSNSLKEKTGKFHYTWAVRVLIGMVENWRQERTLEPIEYIFDRMPGKGRDREKKREIDALFEHAENQDDSLHAYGIYKGCHSFRDRCDVTPLQASDLLAWSVYQRAMEEVTTKVPRDIAIELYGDFTRHGKVLVGMASREQIAEFVSRGNFDPEKYRTPRVSLNRAL